MTKSQYEAKYGESPATSQTTSPKTTQVSPPVKMTRSEYEIKYGEPPPIPIPSETTSPKERSVFGKVAEFVSPTITRTVDKIRAGEDVGFRDIAGSALEAGSFIVPAGAIGKVLGLGIKGAIKGAQAVKRAKQTKQALTLGQKTKLGAATGGISGALQGAGRETGEGGSLGDIALATAGGATAGAIFGGAIPLGGKVAGKALGKVAQRSPENRLIEMTKNLRTLQNSYEEGVRKTKIGGKVIERSNPIKTITDRKLVPEVIDGRTDTTKLVDSLKGDLEKLTSQRSPTIQKSKKTISVRQFTRDVLKTIQESKELRNSGQVVSTMKKAQAILTDFRKSFGGRLTLRTLDDIRVQMNRRFDPELRDVFRAVGDAARKNVYRMDKGSRPILQQEGDLLAAMRFAETLNNRPVKGGRLGGYVSSILGAMVGGTLQIPVAGPILGAFGGRAIDSAIRNAYFKSPGSATAQKLLNVGNRVDQNLFGQTTQKPRSVFGRPKPNTKGEK